MEVKGKKTKAIEENTMKALVENIRLLEPEK